MTRVRRSGMWSPAYIMFLSVVTTWITPGRWGGCTCTCLLEHRAVPRQAQPLVFRHDLPAFPACAVRLHQEGDAVPGPVLDRLLLLIHDVSQCGRCLPHLPAPRPAARLPRHRPRPVEAAAASQVFAETAIATAAGVERRFGQQRRVGRDGGLPWRGGGRGGGV